MPKRFAMLFLVALAACSINFAPLKASHTSESRLPTLASIPLPRDSQTRQSFVVKDANGEVYQVADEGLLVEPEFMEPTEPEFMEPEEPEFMEPEEPEYVEPEMPEFMKPTHPDFLEPSKPEITDSSDAEAAE